MSRSEMTAALDQVDAEQARLETYRLHLVAGLDNIGYAEQIGAHDTARFLEFRYRLNGIDARRDVRLARALPKYPTVSEALAEHTTNDDHDSTDDAGEPGDGTAPDANLGTVDAQGDTEAEGRDGATDGGTTRTTGWVLHP